MAASTDDQHPAGIDAPRRTHLANERTYLAWWRSGLAAIAVGFAAGKFGPIVTHEEAWPYAILGGGFILLGVAVVWHARDRRFKSRAAIDRGEEIPEDQTWVTAITVVSGVLALGLFVMLFVGI